MPRTIFVITRGDTLIKIIECRNQTGAPLDLTGAQIIMTVKRNISDPDKDKIFQKTTINGGVFIPSPTNGKFELRINPIDTKEVDLGDYYFDIQIRIADNIYTIIKGILTIDPEITIAETI